MTNPFLQFLSANWTAGIEILLLAVSIYYGYLYFRGTRGAKVFTGLAILFILLGALIAIERDTGIRSFAESGVNLDCEISQELLLTIFFPKTPLHDGGIIIRDDRIIAAACIFPVSQREDLDRTFGLRHRAGLGITEESDAIAIVVSEETGNISVCHRGKIERGFKPGNLEKRLAELLLRGDESANEEEELIETEKNPS